MADSEGGRGVSWIKEGKVEDPVVGVYWDCDIEGRAGEIAER